MHPPLPPPVRPPRLSAAVPLAALRLSAATPLAALRLGAATTLRALRLNAAVPLAALRLSAAGLLAAVLLPASPTGAAPVEPAAAAARYAVTDLGVLPGGDLSSATAVNNAGHVVGYATTTGFQQRAFIWRGGALVDLGT